jgi:hypothetical protein
LSNEQAYELLTLLHQSFANYREKEEERYVEQHGSLSKHMRIIDAQETLPIARFLNRTARLVIKGQSPDDDIEDQ